MDTLNIKLSNRHYQYLQQRAMNENDALNDVLAEIIETDIAWQQTLKTDPVALLIGQIDDTLDTHRIDDIIYGI